MAEYTAPHTLGGEPLLNDPRVPQSGGGRPSLFQGGRTGEIACELNLEFHPENYETSASTGKSYVSNKFVAVTSMLPGIQPIGPVERAKIINARKCHAAKMIALRTPRPLDDPIIMHRHERVIQVEEVATSFISESKPMDEWKKALLLENEIEVMSIECMSFRNVLSPGDKVGDGMVMITKLTERDPVNGNDIISIKHRLHFVMEEEDAELEAVEADARGGCLTSLCGMDGVSTYKSIRERDTFSGALFVEENVFHVSWRQCLASAAHSCPLLLTQTYPLLLTQNYPLSTQHTQPSYPLSTRAFPNIILVLIASLKRAHTHLPSGAVLSIPSREKHGEEESFVRVQ
jgi:hypothetical protein